MTYSNPQPGDVTAVLNCHNMTFRSLIYLHAPYEVQRVWRLQSTRWFDQEKRAIKWTTLCLQRLYRRVVRLKEWRHNQFQWQRYLYQNKFVAFWSLTAEARQCYPRCPWQTVNGLLRPPLQSVAIQQFNRYELRNPFSQQDCWLSRPYLLRFATYCTASLSHLYSHYVLCSHLQRKLTLFLFQPPLHVSLALKILSLCGSPRVSSRTTQTYCLHWGVGWCHWDSKQESWPLAPVVCWWHATVWMMRVKQRLRSVSKQLWQ